jgi:dihydroflavonol-4-reductase
MYKVGVKGDECRQMHESNVEGTRNVMEAATRDGVGRIVYVSTIGYFGNTKGRVVDERFERTDLDWLSCYDETKYLAHRVVREYINRGAPALIAQPGGVYGPGDTSDLKLLIDLARRGWAKVLMMPGTGFNFVHVEDAATGIILVHDRGKLGESYALGGQLSTMGELIGKVAALSGHRPPKRELPLWLIKASVPIWGLVARPFNLPPNLRELIKAGAGVTYWATDDKARTELGYSPRNLDEGLKETLEAWT